MNWRQSSEAVNEQRKATAAAVALFRLNHPGERVDLTRAQAEYAAAQGLPPDHFRVANRWTPIKLARALHQRVACESCGGLMDFEFTAGCPQANPRRYTGLFFCDGCGAHFYTLDGLLDVKNKLDRGRSGEIRKVVAE